MYFYFYRCLRFFPPSLSVSHWNNLLKWFFKLWSSETWGLAKFLVVEINGEVKRLEFQDPFHIHNSLPHAYFCWTYLIIEITPSNMCAPMGICTCTHTQEHLFFGKMTLFFKIFLKTEYMINHWHRNFPFPTAFRTTLWSTFMTFLFQLYELQVMVIVQIQVLLSKNYR